MSGFRELALGASRGNPANATSRSGVSTAEWSNAMYLVLGGSMPTFHGSQETVWPELRCAMHSWLKENKAQLALVIDTNRPSWVYHEAFYGHWMIALCLCLHWAHE